MPKMLARGCFFFCQRRDTFFRTALTNLLFTAEKSFDHSVNNINHSVNNVDHTVNNIDHNVVETLLPNVFKNTKQ